MGEQEVVVDVESPTPTISKPEPPKSPLITRIMTPLASPINKVITSLLGYLELTRVNHQEACLPITESRNGNAYYAAFHTLSSGIGFQALVLPLAFITLGWAWGIICLSLVFVWQLYTLWLLIQLHESTTGTRYSRYLGLSMAAFGEKLGKMMALFPTSYLSGGTCVTLIMIGGGTMKLFFQTVSGYEDATSISTVQWYLVFTCSAILLAQLPNLNSIAGVSLIGAITAVTYCTLISVVSVIKGRLDVVSYDHSRVDSDHLARICHIFNALGIIAFAFRGHNLVLEIQGTMPSSLKQPSRVPMWRGVTFSYLIIALCLYPLAIAGYWTYGNLIPSNGGMLSALYKYHRHDTSRVILGLASLFVVISCLTSFQIYAMPVFDKLESVYTSSRNRRCPWWLRTMLRVLFGSFAFFISVAIPFLPSLAGLIGGISLPVTLAYPCFMWIMIKKPERCGKMWCLNWLLGCLGMILSVLLIFGAIWTLVTQGIEANFFKPH